MGHCEMLLAVAGLDNKEIAERTRLLASGDWSSFHRSCNLLLATQTTIVANQKAILANPKKLDKVIANQANHEPGEDRCESEKILAK
jgi:hypothetical protein